MENIVRVSRNKSRTTSCQFFSSKKCENNTGFIGLTSEWNLAIQRNIEIKNVKKNPKEKLFRI